MRWCTAEIKRRLDDSDDGEVPSLGKLFSEFEPIIRFSAFSSQGNDSTLHERTSKNACANFMENHYQALSNMQSCSVNAGDLLNRTTGIRP